MPQEQLRSQNGGMGRKGGGGEGAFTAVKKICLFTAANGYFFSVSLTYMKNKGTSLIENLTFKNLSWDCLC